MTVSVRLTPYGAPAFEALCEEVDAARREAGHFLAPVTVLVGEHRLAVVTRRELARRGHIGVECATLRDLAERLGGEALAAKGRRPASAAVLAAAVRQVLQTSAAGVFGEVRDHLATERALTEAHRTLRDLDERDLGALAKASARASDVVAISRQVQRRLVTGGFHDERDLLTEARRLVGRSGRTAAQGPADRADPHDRATHDTTGPGAGSSAERDPPGAVDVAGLGRVVLYLPQRVGSAALDLLVALTAAGGGFTVVAGSCGAPDADAAVAAVVRRLAGEETWHPPAAAAPAPTRIIAVPDADEEVRTALRGVVEAMRRGVPLEQMAVLYGRNEPYARLLGDQLQAAELPFNGPSARPLTESVLGRFLLGLLGLPGRRYSRSGVMAWLAAVPIRSALEARGDGRWRPVPAAAWERISRRAGVVDGAGDWGRRLEVYCTNRRAEIDRLGEDSDWRRVQIERDLAVADGLGLFMADVLARGEAAGGLRSWRRLAQWAATSIRDLVGGAEWREGNWPPHECAAAERVESCLERLGGLDRVDPEPDLARFRRALEAELATGRGTRGRTGHGLLTGPVGAAFGVNLECVWVLGMAEGTFPGRAVEDSLLSEAERAAVPDALPSPPARLADDHRRFLAVMAGSSGERTLLYPRGDLRRTADRLPSRWLLASAQQLAAGADGSEVLLGAGDLAKLPGGTFRDVPSPTAALRACRFPTTSQEYDLRLLLDHSDSGRSLEEHPLAAPGQPLAPAVSMLAARRASAFTRFDGNLAGCEIAAVAGGRRVVSATQLEAWATCPHGYFMRYMLGVEAVDQPERELRISPLERGDLIHTILDRFFNQVLAAGTLDPATGWGADDRRRLTEIATEAFAEREGQGRVGQRVFWEPERSRIHRELLAFLDVEERWRRAEGCVPWASEKGFGMPPRRRDEEPQPPVEIPLGDGRTVRVRGAVDRIDRTGTGAVVVIDYKTGRSNVYQRLGESPWAIYAGAGSKGSPKRDALPRLQLPLYAHAARQVTAAATEVIAGYWFVTADEGFRWLALSQDESVEAELRWTLASICDGIATGVFPAYPRPRSHPSHCDYCDADRHRAGEVAAQLHRKARSPEMLGWLRVGARGLLPVEEHRQLLDGPPAGDHVEHDAEDPT